MTVEGFGGEAAFHRKEIPVGGKEGILPISPYLH
jgi:hypothetical protein